MGFRVDAPTLGATLQTVVVPGLIITEASYVAGTRLPWHMHKRASFCLMLEGQMTERFGHESHELGRYDITYKPHDTEHTNTCGLQGARCLIVELEAPWINHHEPRGGLALTGGSVTGAAAGDLSQRLYGELLRQDGVTPLAIQSICLELLVVVSRTSEKKVQRRMPSWLQRVRDLLHDGYTEQLSLEILAREASVHPVHLAQVFRRTFGMTIGDYTRRLRIHRGAQQLLTTTRTIADIATDCGFCDQSHFSRVFKLITAATPAEYRRSSGASAKSPTIDLALQ